MMPDVAGGMSPQTLPMPQDGGAGMPTVPPNGMLTAPPTMPMSDGVPIAGSEQDVPLTPEQQAMMQAMQELGLDPNDPNSVALLQQNG